MGKSEPRPPEGRSFRGLVWVLAGMVLLAVLAVWGGRRPPAPPAPAPSPEALAAADSARPGPSPGSPPSSAAGAPGAGGPGESAAARAFRRSVPGPGAAAGAGEAEPGGRPAWAARIRVDGVVDVARMRTNREYRERVQRHLKLRMLVHSPLLNSPECAAVAALAQRMNLSLATVPDLYHALWEARQFERQLREEAAAGRDTGIGLVQTVATEDFLRRFRRDFGVDGGPVLEELMRLPVVPTKILGPPDMQVRSGDELLVDD